MDVVLWNVAVLTAPVGAVDRLTGIAICITAEGANGLALGGIGLSLLVRELICAGLTLQDHALGLRRR